MMAYLGLLLFILFLFGFANLVIATYKVFFEKKGNRRLSAKERMARWRDI